MANGEDKLRRSRKWFLILLVVGLATVGAFIPPMISAWVFGEPKPLVIISGTEWVSVISMIVAAYITGNVFQKKIERDAENKIQAGQTLNDQQEGEH